MDNMGCFCFSIKSDKFYTLVKIVYELTFRTVVFHRGSIVVYGLTNYVIFVSSLTSFSFGISEKAEEIRTKTDD